MIAVDIETKDPHLKQWGPGTFRQDGFIIGVGTYNGKVALWRKVDDPSLIADLKSSQTKVFHNGVYDLDWLINGAGLEINGLLEDTMTRETLLDSYAFSYSLDACCARHGIEGKNKGQTIDSYWTGKGKAIEHLDEIPWHIVGQYCKQDCKATYDLFNAQQPLLEQQDLWYANNIECRLYPLLMHMRRNGFRLDINKAIAYGDELQDNIDRQIQQLSQTYGIADLSLNSARHLERIWKQEHIPIEYTAKGAPSFTAAILDDCQHPIAQQVKHLKGDIKTVSFINGWMDLCVGDRLHPEFYPAKRDDGGTVTGRWSSANPNAQQISAREDKHGPEIRSLFIPEDDCLLGAFDYKQIEYRVFTHFALGPGAEEARLRYNTEENVDYHQMVVDMMGWNDMGKDGRHIAKNLNFGSIYGMGPRSFAERFKQNLLHNHPERDPDNLVPVATSLMNEYFAKVPFVKPTCNRIEDIGTKRGYVKTLSGRRQRMPPSENGCGAYKLINYLIQGSAADILKKGLVDAWDAGVFNTLKLHATVHDESVFSIPRNKEGLEACLQFEQCLRNAYQLKIPLGVDTEVGPDWGHCNEKNWKEFKCLAREQ